MDTAAPTTSELWARLCKQFAWLINGSAFVFGMAGGLFLILIALLCGPFVLDNADRGVFGDPLPFESEAWKRKSHIPFVLPIRMRMASDFIEARQPAGKTRTEIEEMLGPPDSRATNPDRMSYVLGELERTNVSFLSYLDPGEGFYIQRLTIEFDGDRVAKAMIEPE